MNSRQYPDRPFVGVGAVIVDARLSLEAGGARVVLIRRRFEPLAGEWSLPGGIVEAGETLDACVAREMREETGLDVEVGPVIEVFDRITRDDEGRVRYHYVLVDYLCWPSGGTLRAGSDVDAAVWADSSDLSAYHLTGQSDNGDRAGARTGREATDARRAEREGGECHSIATPRGSCCRSGHRARACASTRWRSKRRYAAMHASLAKTKRTGAWWHCSTTSTTSDIQRPMTTRSGVARN